MSLLNDSYISAVDVEDDTVKKAYLLSTTEEKIYLSEDDTSDYSYVLTYSNIDENNNYIGLENKCQATCSDYYLKAYSKDLKLLSEDFDELSFDENGNLVILKNSVIYKYDKNGNKIDENNSYKNIIGIYNNYVLNLDNSEIILYYNNSKLVSLGKLSSGEEIIGGFVDDNGVEVTTSSKKVTVDNIWADWKKEDAYNSGFERYPFEASSKSELKKWLKEYECVNGYRYTYNFKTKKTTKLNASSCEW